MQKKFTTPDPVLDSKGYPVPGYSLRSIMKYSRKDIKAPPYRIKEWDFYQVSDASMCLQFTIGHASYAGQASVMLFDFEKGVKLAEKGTFLVLPFGSLHMPQDAEEEQTLAYYKKGNMITFRTEGDTRTLHAI